MTELRICTTCGKGHVQPLRKSGRTMIFRNFEKLELPDSLAIPTCSNCGDEWYDAETTEAVERALELAAAAILEKIGNDAIRVLAQHERQRDLEDLLDVSRGYLSKVKHGKETPSAALVALLALLAKRPARVEEVRKLWDSKTIGPQLVTTSSNSVRETPDVGALEVMR